MRARGNLCFDAQSNVCRSQFELLQRGNVDLGNAAIAVLARRTSTNACLSSAVAARDRRARS